MEIVPLLNLSLNETLSRTIVTSLSIMLALLMLLIFGPAVIFGLTAAILFGTVIGTYSSIYISGADAGLAQGRLEQLPAKKRRAGLGRAGGAARKATDVPRWDRNANASGSVCRASVRTVTRRTAAVYRAC
jgi:hypothetical protein